MKNIADYYEPTIECASRDLLSAIQSAALKRIVKLNYENKEYLIYSIDENDQNKQIFISRLISNLEGEYFIENIHVTFNATENASAEYSVFKGCSDLVNVKAELTIFTLPFALPEASER